LVAKAFGFLVAITVFLGVSVWQFREAQRLERMLGSDVGFFQASGAFKLRSNQHDRASYPHEWHKGSRRMGAADAVRLAALLSLLALIAASL